MSVQKLLVFGLVCSLLIGGFGVSLGSSERPERSETLCGSFAGGSGTEEDPYEISNVTQLQKMDEDLDAHYELIDDIDASATEGWNDGKGFQPVGSNWSKPFEGSLSGHGYNVSGLYIDRPERGNVGLFGYVRKHGSINGVRVVDAEVIGGNSVGALAGVKLEGMVKNSYVSGEITGDHEVGCLVGSNGREILDCSAVGKVSGNVSVGGLIGGSVGSIVGNCSADVNVDGNKMVGGLIGRGKEDMIYDCNAAGSVSGEGKLGGLFGWKTNSMLSNCYYNIDKVPINGEKHITTGGIFDKQYQDWISNGKNLNIKDYNESLVPSEGYYEIDDVQGLKDLLGFTQGWGNKFKLTSDIDLSGEPGLHIPYLAGSFDGGGNKIKNIYLDWSSGPDFGFFGYSRNRIEDIGLVNVTINGGKSVGGLVGRNRGTVNNSFVNGSVKGHYTVGGVVGNNKYGTINNSYSTADTRGNDNVGGLTGYNYISEVKNSYATGNVSGDEHVGGLLGCNFYEGRVKNSYATGDVEGKRHVGGLIGDNGYGGKVNNSYESGDVNGDEHLGGLVGSNDGTLKNSHYDINDVSINGEHLVTAGGLFQEQYKDWISNNRSLDIEDYNDTLVPSGEYYEISSVEGIEDLLGFSDEDGYRFQLTSDIDLSGQSGLYVPSLSADFYGNGHTISNLRLDMSFNSNLGLFGIVGEKGYVNDLHLVNVSISGSSSVGGIAGRNEEGRIEDSFVTGDVSGRTSVGGLVGDNSGPVEDSYVKGDVTGEETVGGLTGTNHGTINRTFASGKITGESDVGGLIGYNHGSISDSYSRGEVSGNVSVGGLVAYNDEGTINRSYASGAIDGENKTGGLVGKSYEGEVNDSFWDVDTTGLSESEGGTGKTTKEMKDISTFTDESTEGLNGSWDFTKNPNDDDGKKDIWSVDESGKINDGYPYLRYQIEHDKSTQKDSDMLESAILILIGIISLVVFYRYWSME